MKKIEVTTLDYYELDELINRTFFGDENVFEFVAHEEMGNDSEKLYQEIDGKFNKYDEEALNNFLSRKRIHYKTFLALNELCRRKIIEPGNYLIEVSW